MSSKLNTHSGGSPPTKPSHDLIHHDDETAAADHQYQYRPPTEPATSSTPIITVQPPRREDLQPSYAQTLVAPGDSGSHGWYGSMSASSILPLLFPFLCFAPLSIGHSQRSTRQDSARSARPADMRPQ